MDDFLRFGGYAFLLINVTFTLVLLVHTNKTIYMACSNINANKKPNMNPTPQLFNEIYSFSIIGLTLTSATGAKTGNFGFFLLFSVNLFCWLLLSFTGSLREKSIGLFTKSYMKYLLNKSMTAHFQRSQKTECDKIH